MLERGLLKLQTKYSLQVEILLTQWLQLIKEKANLILVIIPQDLLKLIQQKSLTEKKIYLRCMQQQVCLKLIQLQWQKKHMIRQQKQLLIFQSQVQNILKKVQQKRKQIQVVVLQMKIYQIYQHWKYKDLLMQKKMLARMLILFLAIMQAVIQNKLSLIMLIIPKVYQDFLKA